MTPCSQRLVLLLQAFDEAIRGQPLGSTTVLEAKGGDWQRELFFEVNPGAVLSHSPPGMHARTHGGRA